MPIELRTGLPGAGKTLGAVEELIRLRKASPDRPLYVHGITDLRDGLAIPLDAEGVRNWQQLPPGAILFVDEVQKLMPAKRGAIDSPQWVRDLSEHRHLGLDFVFITQHPSLIDAYVRKLVDRHIHTVRVFGSKMVERWSWPICQADPNSKGAKKDAESKTRHTFNKAAMASYTSAELHTVQRRIPRFIFVAVALLLAFPLLGWVGYKAMHYAGNRAGAANAPPVSASGASASGSQQGKPSLSKEEWVKQQVPRIAGIPWSAPIYDGQKVQAQPDLYCVKVDGDDGFHDCICHTDQGTRATVPRVMCLAFAEGGVYNPYRQPLRTASSFGDSSSLRSQAGAGAASAQPSQTGIAADVGSFSSVDATRRGGQFTSPMPRGPYVPPEYMLPNR